MSRSHKKPYINNTCLGNRAGMQKKWKKECNRLIRRIPIEAEIPNNSGYSKYSDPWQSPADGNHYWTDPAGVRK